MEMAEFKNDTFYSKFFASHGIALLTNTTDIIEVAQTPSCDLNDDYISLFPSIYRNALNNDTEIKSVIAFY